MIVNNFKGIKIRWEVFSILKEENDIKKGFFYCLFDVNKCFWWDK